MATTMPRSAGRFDSPDTLALDWKGLYQEHAPRLRRIAARRVGPAQAEDVVQDAFMRAFRNRASLDPSRPIGAWLSSITLYSSTDTLRSRSIRPEVPVDEECEPTAVGCSVEDDFDNAVRRLGIEAAFDSLNHRQRRVLRRLEVDGWTQEQVAEVEHMSTEAVKSLAARARRTFREAYVAFSERMGVFGAAAVGPAIWRLRSRLQRFQVFAGDHVGAFGVAAATVTVVAIATVPTTRATPTRAVEPVTAPGVSANTPSPSSLETAESDRADTSSAHITASSAPKGATSAPTPTLIPSESPSDPGPPSAGVDAKATAAVGKRGSRTGIGFTGRTDGPQDDGVITTGAYFSDCGGVVAGTFCLVVEHADPALQRTPTE